jgi:hypothetical protein
MSNKSRNHSRRYTEPRKDYTKFGDRTVRIGEKDTRVPVGAENSISLQIHHDRINAPHERESALNKPGVKQFI